MAPPYFQVVALCFLGGLLGLAAMIPLRKLLIVDSAAELPYPEGTACAEVLRATVGGGSGGAWIFRGIAVGAAVKVLVALVFLVPGDVSVVRNLPTMWGAFAAVAKGFRRTEVSEDLPGWFVVTAIALVPIVCALVPGVFAGDLSFAQRAVCAAGVAIFGVLFVAVAARIV